jgi:hypothetical protein
VHIRLNDWKQLSQKDLYFKLKDCFLIEDIKTTPPSGIYRIFKNDICLYVGQSKNIPSRLATHLSGKYRNDSTHIMIDYYHVEDLDQEEQIYMRMLKPIENINIEMGKDFDPVDPEVCHYQKSFHHLILINNKKRIDTEINFNDIYTSNQMILVDGYISESTDTLNCHLREPKKHLKPIRSWGIRK